MRRLRSASRYLPFVSHQARPPSPVVSRRSVSGLGIGRGAGPASAAPVSRRTAPSAASSTSLFILILRKWLAPGLDQSRFRSHHASPTKPLVNSSSVPGLGIGRGGGAPAYARPTGPRMPRATAATTNTIVFARCIVPSLRIRKVTGKDLVSKKEQPPCHEGRPAVTWTCVEPATTAPNDRKESRHSP